MKLQVTIDRDEDGVFVVECPAIPGCVSQGRTEAEALIQALIKLQSQSTSNATSIAQYAALEAMRGTMETVPVMLAEYAKRRKRIVEGLRAIPGVTCEWPGGAFYAFPNISEHTSGAAGRPALAKSCTEISKLLLEKVHVAVVPGEAEPPESDTGSARSHQ